MQKHLHDYIPEGAILHVETLLDLDQVSIIVKRERKTRHGDYRRLPNGRHQITINANLNPYRFLITLNILK